MQNSLELSRRRQKLLKSIGHNNAAIFFSSAESIRNGDVHYPFRQDSDFYYFTAFNESSALLYSCRVIKKGHLSYLIVQEILF